MEFFGVSSGVSCRNSMIDTVGVGDAAVWRRRPG